MRSTIIILHLFIALSFTQNAYHLYFNEIRADDESTDDIEFIELIGPAGLDLSGFTIVHYNGSETSDGGLWQHNIGSFTIPDDGTTDDQGVAIGFYVLAAASVLNIDETLPGTLQNGPDGLILYDSESNIIDAVAWEGAGDLTGDDPGTISTGLSVLANSFLHVLADDDVFDNSLQAPNKGFADDGSGWLLGGATPGEVNFNQVNGDISLPVELASLSATGFEDHISIKWRTASEIENAGFLLYRSENAETDYLEIASYRFNEVLIGLGNSSTGREYRYEDMDPVLKKDQRYFYQIADVDFSGKINFHGPVQSSLKVDDDVSEPEKTFHLYQNYPNPFNPSTTIKVFVDEPILHAELDILDVSGRMIRKLFSGPLAGNSLTLSWDGKNDSGAVLASGLYFYRFRTGGRTLMKKMILLR